MSKLFSMGDNLLPKIIIIGVIFLPMIYLGMQMAREGLNTLQNIEPKQEPNKELEYPRDDVAEELERLEQKSQEIERETDIGTGLFLMVAGIVLTAILVIPIIMIIKG